MAVLMLIPGIRKIRVHKLQITSAWIRVTTYIGGVMFPAPTLTISAVAAMQTHMTVFMIP